MNVLEYFTSAFPGHDFEENDREDFGSMPLDSTCGDDCKAAIDAGKALLAHVEMAHGKTNSRAVELSQRISSTVADVLGVFICG